MSYFLQTVYTRPSLDVSFPPTFTDAEKQHIRTTFGKKITESTMADSPNNLSRTVVRIFDSQASADLFKADAVVTAARTVRDAYNTANGITVSSTEGVI